MYFYQCIDVNKNQLIYKKTNKLKIKTLFTFETISYCILTSTYYYKYFYVGLRNGLKIEKKIEWHRILLMTLSQKRTEKLWHHNKLFQRRA
jgi:hypothetical protein